MAQLRDLLVNGQSRFLGPAMFNDIVKFDKLLCFNSDARAEGDFVPNASQTYSLGTETLKWKNVYAQQFVGSFVGTVTGAVVGNAQTATKLQTSRNINGTAFDGSANITTSYWGTARTFSISKTANDSTTTVDGSENETFYIPKTIDGFTKITSTTFEGSLNGTATSAIKATQDGSGNVITATYAVKNHASTDSTYGLGSGTNYGHVKLSDATDSTSGVSGGIAATPAAVKAAYDLANSKVSTNASSIELNQTGALASYGGFIDFHFHNSDKKPLNASGTVVDKTPDYTSRIIEDAAGQLSINGVKFKNNIVTGSFTGTLTGALVGNATTATTLQNSRSFTIGNTSKNFDGSANVSWTSNEIGYNHVWSAKVKGQTWSRLCHVAYGTSVEGASYLLNIAATRGNVVYHDTFLIKAHHSSNGKIIKISGSNYSQNHQVRLLVDSSGNSYFELYDNCNGIATTTEQTVHCNLIPIFTGAVTTYTSFTSGASIPSGYSEKQVMTITNNDIQANVTGNLTGNASTASYANNADTVDGKHASDFSTSTHTHSVTHTPAGTVSAPTFTGEAVMTSTGGNSKKTMYSITSVGSAPSLTASVSNKCLTLTFSAGSVPTRESASVALSDHTHSVTAKGSISQPTFTGTSATLTTSAPA